MDKRAVGSGVDGAQPRAAEREPTAKPETEGHLGALALALAGVLWGTTFLFGKWALEEMGPAHVTLYRFALASAALLPYALLMGYGPSDATCRCSWWSAS